MMRHVDGPDAVLRHGDHPDHVVDVHLPTPRLGVRTRAPLAVLLHGGFWRAEHDRRHTRPLAVALREQGYAVATPEYRRTGADGGWPGTFDDVARIRSRLPGLLDDALPGLVAPRRPIVVGHSAGGHLALWWALTGRREDAAHAVALAPVADLARAYAENLGDGAVRDLMGGGPARHPDRYAAADTAVLLRRWAGRRPVVVHGDADEQVPVAHSRGLVGIDLVELPATDHFAIIDPLSPAWPHVLRAIGGRSAPCV